MPTLTKVCPCRREFETTNDRRVYCSEPCARHFQHKRTQQGRTAQYNKAHARPYAEIGVHAEVRRIRAMVYAEGYSDWYPGWRYEAVVHTCPGCGGHNVEAEQGDYHRERFVCWDCEWQGTIRGKVARRYKQVIAQDRGFLDLSHSRYGMDDGGAWWL